MGWPFAIWDPESSWAIPGLADQQDVEDVVPASVRINLETWAVPTLEFPLVDSDRNHRTDGSTRGIFLHVSNSEDHREVDERGSETMGWVLEQLDLIVE